MRLPSANSSRSAGFGTSSLRMTVPIMEVMGRSEGSAVHTELERHCPWIQQRLSENTLKSDRTNRNLILLCKLVFTKPNSQECNSDENTSIPSILCIYFNK